MGTVKFFSPSGGTPTPPTYLNYVGMLAGSFANQTGLNGQDGDIIIPLNNTSRVTSPTSLTNITHLDFGSSGQDISFYIVGANIVLSNINNASSNSFRIDIYVDGSNIQRKYVDINETFGIIELILDTPVSVTYNIYVLLRTDNNNFDIVSSNWLFYSTGNIIPPEICEYFEKVSATNGGSVLTCTSPIVGLSRETPLTYQANLWKGGTAGNRVPRIRQWASLSSDPTATPLQGETYYVEATLSQPYGVNKKIYLFFGYNINSRGSTSVPYIDGNLTTPQGFYLEWNPNNEVDPLFMFIGEAYPTGYNGILTFKVGTANCPV